MVSVSIAFMIALLVAAFAVPWVRQRALNWGAVDDPARARKIHASVTPRMGGLAIAAGFFAALVALLALETEVAKIFADDFKRVVGLFGGAVAMLALGVYDDLLGANAKKKFTVQIGSALLLVALGFYFDRIALPWGGELTIGWLGVPLAILWVVGITNAVNLIDGLDGLAAGVVMFVVVTMCAVSLFQGNVVASLITGALAGALVGFLFHNFHPATIFMGDTGSLFIGFVVAATGLMANTKSSTAVALLIPMVALGLPILDTTLATFRRLLAGKSPFDADQEHIHHRLLKRGLSHRRTVLALWGFCVAACLAALGMVLTKGLGPVAILAAFAAVALGLARILGYLRFAALRPVIEQGQKQRKRQRGRKARLRAIVRRVEGAESVDEIFDAIRPFHNLHGYSCAKLEVYEHPQASAPPAVKESREWRRGEDEARQPPLQVWFDLTGRAGTLGRICYEFDDGRERLEVDEEQMMHHLHAALSLRLAALDAGEASGRVIPLRRAGRF